METSGSLQDHSRVHGESEDLDHGETDFHKQDEEAELYSQDQDESGKSSSSSSSSSGAEHGEPDVLKNELQLYEGAPGEVVPSEESGLRRRGSNPESEVDPSQLRRLNIKKDDEFFHFILLCFAVGALLVCYHYYKDWFMSLGVGLLTFASLETVGIYFGLVYRIHSVLHGFIPLFQRFRLIGVFPKDILPYFTSSCASFSEGPD
ncbi:transmembrane protein 40 isoform X1 [Lagenorhynchus albirostris]|uniref:transmembrane protein 40 isoform X1 n=1 Tax=Lagenorhynchus albirostris TaxID=27610 RepID=UPI0028EED22C|nr:transmembrane protein 40 isoform X1 [Lagenorhynchus albirostris]